MIKIKPVVKCLLRSAPPPSFHQVVEETCRKSWSSWGGSLLPVESGVLQVLLLCLASTRQGSRVESSPPRINSQSASKCTNGLGRQLNSKIDADSCFVSLHEPWFLLLFMPTPRRDFFLISGLPSYLKSQPHWLFSSSGQYYRTFLLTMMTGN